MEYIVVLTTTEKKKDAERIAESLVEKKLAACVQVLGPINSVYKWKGKIEKAEEWLCLIKSRKSIYSEIEKAIRLIHPYEVPEIIALPVVAGSADFLSWLGEETKSRPEG